jgi:hypothetical protein
MFKDTNRGGLCIGTGTVHVWSYGLAATFVNVRRSLSGQVDFPYTSESNPES